MGSALMWSLQNAELPRMHSTFLSMDRVFTTWMHRPVTPINYMLPLGKMALCVDGYEMDGHEILQNA